MPELLSLALFERDGKLLATRRKENRPPFAGRWFLPAAVVGERDSAEEAIEDHAFKDLGVEIETPEFVETLYLEDDATRERYVANVFRISNYEGELRFRAAGDYDDARWLSPGEVEQTSMPAVLSEWVAGGAQPLAEAGPVALPALETAPDNRSAWNAISRAYQERYQLPTDRLIYAPRCPDESELQLLGDVEGITAVVLGCGGGQDCIVLAKQGARVTGIDLSDRQIEYGRRLAEREGVEVTLVQGDVADLGMLDDESQDLALSIHALNYVERVDRTFAETHRVLRPGGSLVFSVHHPFDAMLDDVPPYGVARSYWQREVDWQWDFSEKKVSARMRSWYRPVSEWVTLAVHAGFRVDRMLEPPPTEERTSPWDVSYSLAKMKLVPATLIMKVTKPWS